MSGRKRETAGEVYAEKVTKIKELRRGRDDEGGEKLAGRSALKSRSAL